jgi:PBSX family phage terminase large subunit
MRDILGDFVKYYIGKQEMEILGRKIYVVSANDARSEGKIRGSTFVGAYIDEATLLPETFFKMLLSRLSLPGAKLFATTNPDSPYHWLRRDFLDRAADLDLLTWEFKIEDNPSLSGEFVKQIKQEYSGLWYQRFIEGKWVQAEGAVYDFFDPSIHCIDYPTHPATHYIAGIDYGTSNAFACVLIGINYDHWPNMWVESEYYFDSKISQRQKTDYEYANDLELFLKWKPIKAIYIDPSAASFRLELGKRNIDSLFEAKNEVLDGIRLVAQHLTQGTLKICRQCKNTVAQFQSYVWDPKSNKLGVDRPLKENDHACVTGDTKILLSFGEVPISDIHFPEFFHFGLINYNLQTNKIESDLGLNACLTRKNAEIYELELEDGKVLRATGDHRVMTQRGLFQLQQLTLCDVVYTCPTNCSINMRKEDSVENPALSEPLGVKIRSIKRGGLEDVYCLASKINGTMVANGIITKNCDALRYAIFSHFFESAGVPLSPQDIERAYSESRGHGKVLPRFFQDPQSYGSSF